jgi:hypothetical protein
MSAIATTYTLHQALRWRDILWSSILDDFEQRDSAGAQAVYSVLAEQPTRVIVGASTSSARVAWPYLDLQAREDWLWVAQFVQRAWVRGALAGMRQPARSAR